jgi:predicted ArsR family transcriptional regulator
VSSTAASFLVFAKTHELILTDTADARIENMTVLASNNCPSLHREFPYLARVEHRIYPENLQNHAIQRTARRFVADSRTAAV